MTFEIEPAAPLALQSLFQHARTKTELRAAVGTAHAALTGLLALYAVNVDKLGHMAPAVQQAAALLRRYPPTATGATGYWRRAAVRLEAATAYLTALLALADGPLTPRPTSVARTSQHREARRVATRKAQQRALRRHGRADHADNRRLAARARKLGLTLAEVRREIADDATITLARYLDEVAAGLAADDARANRLPAGGYGLAHFRARVVHIHGGLPGSNPTVNILNYYAAPPRGKRRR